MNGGTLEIALEKKFHQITLWSWDLNCFSTFSSPFQRNFSWPSKQQNQKNHRLVD
jgi:hypothetical protein